MVPDSQQPGYHEHDGFYMRLCMGAGYLRSSASYKGDTATYSGGGVAMNLAFGGSVTPNLVIFGELSMSTAIDPSFKVTGESSMTLKNVTLEMMNLGPGIAYYFTPANVYLSGALTFSQLTVAYDSSDDRDSEDLSDLGIGGSFMIGKEWWISRDWGLGLASMLQLASMKDKGVDTRWFSTAWSLLFSATYN